MSDNSGDNRKITGLFYHNLFGRVGQLSTLVDTDQNGIGGTIFADYVFDGSATTLSPALLTNTNVMAGPADPLNSYVRAALSFENGLSDLTGKTTTVYGSVSQTGEGGGKFGKGGAFGYGRLTVADIGSFGTQPGCVEMFIYSAGNPTFSRYLWALSTTNALIFQMTNGEMFVHFGAPGGYLSAPALPTGQWVHLAVSREASGITRVFFDGVQQAASGTGELADITPSDGYFTVGASTYDSTNMYANFIVDDVVLTIGHPRYTGNFTPPTQSILSVSGPTVSYVDSVSPARLDNTNALYAHNVIQDVVLSASRLDNTTSLHTPVISTQYGVTAPRIDNTGSFYGHSVNTNASLSAPRLNNVSSLYAPVLASSAQVAAARLDNTASLFAHVVASSAQLAPLRLDNVSVQYGHTVSTGAQLNAARLDNAQQFNGHTLTAGAVGLTPSRLDNVNEWFSHYSSQDAAQQNVFPPILNNAAQFYGHALTGSYNIAAPRVESTSNLISPLVYTDSPTILAPRIENAWGSYVHVVSTGEVTLAPELLVSTPVFPSSGVAASYDLICLRSDNGVVLYEPNVTVDAGLVVPTIPSAQTFFAHNLTGGDHEVSIIPLKWFCLTEEVRTATLSQTTRTTSATSDTAIVAQTREVCTVSTTSTVRISPLT